MLCPITEVAVLFGEEVVLGAVDGVCAGAASGAVAADVLELAGEEGLDGLVLLSSFFRPPRKLLPPFRSVMTDPQYVYGIWRVIRDRRVL